jgi:putative salt-induced outer membrane protein YdiY
LGFISTTGNTDTTSINAGITANQEFESWSNDYIIEGLYRQETVEGDNGEDVDVTSAQKFFASAQGNYKLENPDNRLFVFTSYEDDRFSNFNYQATVAAGWNQKLIQNKKHKLEYSIGPGYAFVETQEGESQNSMIVRASTIYSWKISDTAKFTQTASTEVGDENTKSRAESALTATISGNLSMRLSFKLDHNSQVAEGVEKLDTETAVSLVYNFF